MVCLVDVCGVDLIVRHFVDCGASVGLKLLRAKALNGPAEDITTASCAFRSAVASCTHHSAAHGDSACWAEQQLLGLERDSPDEVLVRLLPMASATKLLGVAVARNFPVTSALLVERGADVHIIEVRRGRRRSLVDMAARAAGLDGDWRLVRWLLRNGARPEAPQSVIFTPLRLGDIALARELVHLGVQCSKSGWVSLLCDVCSHGATEAAEMLIDELGVPVNAQNECDGDSCLDRALAWHCWDTAEWLVMCKGGSPTKPGFALGHLLDSAGEAGAARVLGALRAKGLLSVDSLLEAAVQRGDASLCEELVRTSLSSLQGKTGSQLPIVDAALCHGLCADDAARARADTHLHGGVRNRPAAEILALLPPAALGVAALPQGLSKAEACPASRASEDERTPSCNTSGDSFVGIFEGLVGRKQVEGQIASNAPGAFGPSACSGHSTCHLLCSA
mmetsp:Transcript_1920/g.4232  ORF Transcript_1920/g.4232 Transcript_1920/m.4232 type:complete len:450 (+) Transcript_1920:46-1395(+)